MRGCSASRSASEKTATVRQPSSRQARMTRNAISPRLAMRTFPNKLSLRREAVVACLEAGRFNRFQSLRCLRFRQRLTLALERHAAAIDDEQRLTEVDRLAVVDDLRDQRAIDRTDHSVAQAQRFDVPEHLAVRQALSGGRRFR